MRTCFENLEALLQRESDNGFKTAYLTGIKAAMIADWHLLFHDAAWEDGCPVCDKEREASTSVMHHEYRAVDNDGNVTCWYRPEPIQYLEPGPDNGC